jgi:hypothetical protein
LRELEVVFAAVAKGANRDFVIEARARERRQVAPAQGLTFRFGAVWSEALFADERPRGRKLTFVGTRHGALGLAGGNSASA